MIDRFGQEEPGGVYARLDPESKSLCALWRAAIAQAVRDLTSAEKVNRVDAAFWFLSQDFWECCSLASIRGIDLKADIRKAMSHEKDLYRRKEIMDIADDLNSGRSIYSE